MADAVEDGQCYASNCLEFVRRYAQRVVLTEGTPQLKLVAMEQQ